MAVRLLKKKIRANYFARIFFWNRELSFSAKNIKHRQGQAIADET